MPQNNPAKNIVKLRQEAGEDQVIAEGSFD